MSHCTTKLSKDEAISAVCSHLKLPRGKRDVRIACPVHGGKNKTAFAMDTIKGVAYCWSDCQRGWGPFQLLKELGLQSNNHRYKFTSEDERAISALKKNLKNKNAAGSKESDEKQDEPKKIIINRTVYLFDTTDPLIRLQDTRVDYSDGSKSFFVEVQKHIDGNWIKQKNLKFNGKDFKALPYNHLNLQQMSSVAAVFVVEGVKCADVLKEKLDFDETEFAKELGLNTNKLKFPEVITSIGGSGAASKTDWSCLSGKEVVLVPDCDEVGRKYVDTIGKIINTSAKEIKIIELDEFNENNVAGFDIVDYFEDGHLAGDLTKNPWKKQDSSSEQASEDAAKKQKRRKIDEDQVIKKNAAGLAKALDALGIEIRDCILTKSYQMKIGDGKWEKFSDKNVDYVRNLIGDNFLVQYTDGGRYNNAVFSKTEDFPRCINALMYRKEVNSFTEDYLKKLPKWNPETMVSSERLFIDCLGAEDNLLNRSIGRMIVQAIVERAYCNRLEGVKFDYLPILIGPLEGEGKSTFCEKLLQFPLFYLNTFDIATDTKVQQESIMGKIVVEMAELVGADKPEVEKKLKNLLSISTEPQVRHAYKHFPVEHHRLCVFIATTNDETPIKLTGSRNRRMVPIRVKNYGRQHVVGWLKKHRDEIFSHGIHCMNNKEPLYFQGEVEQEQVEAVYAATSQDTDTIDQIFEWHEDRMDDKIFEFSMDELIAHLYRLCEVSDRKEITSMRYRKQKYLGKLLQNNGFKKDRFIRKGEKKQRVYYFRDDGSAD